MSATSPFQEFLEGELYVDPLVEKQAAPKPLTAPPADPIQEFMGLLDKEEEQRVTQALDASKGIDPDLYARAKKVQELGPVQAPISGMEPKEISEAERIAAIRQTLSENPAFRDWFVEQDTGRTIKVDELHDITGLQWTFRSAKEAGQSGVDQVELSRIRVDQMFGRATEDAIRRADQLSNNQSERTYGSEGWLEGGWTGMWQMLPGMGYVLAEAFKSGTQGAMVGAATGAATGAAVGGTAGIVAGGPAAPVTGLGGAGAGAAAGAATGAVTGFSAGATIGSMKGSFQLEAGLAYDEFIKFRTPDGRGLDNDTAVGAAILVGGVNSMLEVYSLGRTLKGIPGLEHLSGGMLRQGIQEALKNPSVAAAIGRFGKEFLARGAVEVSTESLQEMMTIIGGEVAKSYQGGFEQLSMSDAVDRVAKTAIQTAQVMTILGAVGPSAGFVRDINAARNAAANQRVFLELQRSAAENKFRERNPEAAKKAIQIATQDSGKETVYIPAQKAVELFQSEGINPSQLEQVIPGISENFGEAIATGGHVSIPVDQYYTYIAGAPIGEKLLPHVKFSPSDMTMNEAKEYNEAWETAKEELFKQDLAVAGQVTQQAAVADQIFNDVRTKAISAGIVPDQADSYATLYRAFFNTLGERTGENPFEIYQRYGFEIRSQAQMEGEQGPGRVLNQVAFHGTRARFDQFSTDFVDGRDGSQQFGWGLYFAGDRKVAESYRKNLSMGRRNKKFEYNDGQITVLSDDTPESIAVNLLNTYRDYESVEIVIDRELKQINDAATIEKMRAARDVVRTIDINSIKPREPGFLYEVHLPEDNELLDWEALLSQQPKGVLDKLRRAIPKLDAEYESSYTGRELYRALAEEMESEQAVSQMLAQAGIPGHRFDSGQQGNTTNFVIYDDSVIDIDRMLFQKTEKEIKRGSIRLSDGATIITLFENQNLSTFLHESGHFFLEVFADVASAKSAPQQIKDDWAVLQKELGFNGRDIPTESHEKFAQSFEAYLYEGRAPSAEMQGIFARFRSWLLFVYRSIMKFGGPVSEPVRTVMDRMLASDSEIESMARQVEFRPLLRDAVSINIPPAVYAEYMSLAQRAVDASKNALDRRIIMDVRRETQDEWRRLKSEVREEVSKEFSQQRQYQALHYLRTGDSINPGIQVPSERLRMDRATLASMFPDRDILSELPKNVPPIYTTKDGVHPDIIAAMFGYDSGHEMIKQLVGLKPLGRAITEETNKRMKDRYGDIMGDQAKLGYEALKEMHNDDRGIFIETELKVLSANSKRADPPLPRAYAAQAARTLVGAKRIQESQRLNVYVAAEQQAAKEAEAAYLKQDFDAAAIAKRKQLFAHYMALEAKRAAETIERTVKYLSKFDNRKPSIDPGYMDQIEAMLERFDFKRVSDKRLARRKSLAEFVREREAEGDLVKIPEPLLNEAMKRHYKDMTLDELKTVSDAVRNIEHLGKLKQKLRVGRERREFRAVADELAASVAILPEKKNSKYRNPTKLGMIAEGLRGMDAALLKMEQIIDWLDRGDINGPARRYLWQPIADAQGLEQDLHVTYLAKMIDILTGTPKGYLTERISVPEAAKADGSGYVFTRAELYTVALNMGNMSNRSKLLKGEGWNEATLMALTDQLNEMDWNRIQQIWDLLDSMWPEIAAIQKRLTGVEPERVEPAVVSTKFGDYKGGYYPIVYDPRRSIEADRNLDADTLFENTFIAPSTDKGYTKERAKQYARPIMLDLNILPEHMMKVVHDLTHREAVRDVYRLVNDNAVRDAIGSRMGMQIYAQFLPWLKAIANDRIDNRGLRAWDRLMMKTRANVTMVGMGFRISTMLAQPAGYVSAMAMLSPKWAAAGLKEFFSHPFESAKFVNQKSAEMRHRHNTMERDIRESLNAIIDQRGVVHDARRFAFYGIAMMDKGVSVPLWIGAYQEHLSKYKTDEAGAIAYADKVVRLTQGSGAAKDLSAIQRGNNFTKLITMFYSYFNALYNQYRALGKDISSAYKQGRAEDFPHLLARSFFLSVAPAILGSLLVGDGPSEEKEETAVGWALKKVLLYPFSSIPVIRDIANYYDKGFGYQFTPAARAVDVGTKFVDQVVNVAQGEPDPRLLTKRAIETSGYVFGLPVGQAATTIDNVWQGLEEDDLRLKDLFLPRNR